MALLDFRWYIPRYFANGNEVADDSIEDEIIRLELAQSQPRSVSLDPSDRFKDVLNAESPLPRGH